MDDHLDAWLQRLAADPALGDPASRSRSAPSGHQPIHTVYVGAHDVDAELPARWQQAAIAALSAYAGRPHALAEAFGLGAADDGLAERVHAAISERLAARPIEDLRVDFEDGYGRRPDAEEDGHATAAARALATAARERPFPRSLGLRVKALEPGLAERALRTLRRFLSAFREDDPPWPERFVVTLPKVVSPTQVEVAAEALGALEQEHGLADGTLQLELMVETTRSFFDADGRFLLPRLSAAAGGRCTGAHLGTFDLTASWGVAAPHQHLRHPACDAARTLMKLAWAQGGPWLCDGSTHVLPVAPHDAHDPRAPLADARRLENERVVHTAWRLHARHVRLALEEGFAQGWDLHPLQLPARFAAVACFHLATLPDVQRRLSALLAAGASGTAVGAVQDDAATGQALLDLLRRGLATGFLNEDDARAAGLTAAERDEPSLLAILARRG